MTHPTNIQNRLKKTSVSWGTGLDKMMASYPNAIFPSFDLLQRLFLMAFQWSRLVIWILQFDSKWSWRLESRWKRRRSQEEEREKRLLLPSSPWLMVSVIQFSNMELLHIARAKRSRSSLKGVVCILVTPFIFAGLQNIIPMQTFKWPVKWSIEHETQLWHAMCFYRKTM